MSDRFPMGIPFGWFFIAYADELKPKDIKSLFYFNRHMVLFRTEKEDLGLMDAYCLHMGAHLGQGGVVEGDTIRCPFHDWAFDTKGHCKDIPYSSKIPKNLQNAKKCQKTYPVVEKNGVIWAWYHPQDLSPTFEVDEHPEVSSKDWLPLEKYQWTFHSNPQEIAENGVDFAHFEYVHGMSEIPEGAFWYDGIKRISTAEGVRKIPDRKGGYTEKVTKIKTIQNGAGQKYTKITGLTDTMVMVLVTPITKEKLELRFAFTHKKAQEDSLEYKAARATISRLIGKEGVAGDIPIWDNKVYHKHPLLCDGDGPIMKFRKYFKQFYAESF